MKKLYHFYGFIQSLKFQAIDIDKKIEAYSEKQAKFLLAKELNEMQSLKTYHEDTQYYFRVINKSLQRRTLHLK